MDSWLSVPILYFLLLFSQLTFADSSSSGGDAGGEKDDDLSNVQAIHNAEFRNFNPGSDQQEMIRYLLMAAQNHREPMSQFRGQTWGIPFRPARRIGSEFLGKRSDTPPSYDFKRARIGSEFLGKRGMEFSKRRIGSEFLGKRGDTNILSEQEYLEKLSPQLLLQNYENSPLELDEDSTSHLENPYNFLVAKREFLGKRKQGNSYDFSWKRGRRLGSEFLGKRSTTPEEPSPYLQTNSILDISATGKQSSGEEKQDAIPRA